MNHNLEAEEAILGSVMMEPKLIPHISEIIPSAKYFHHMYTQCLWTVLLNLYEKDVGIDQITISQEIKDSGFEEKIDHNLISEIHMKTPTSAHWKHYAEIVAEAWKSRQLAKRCSTALKMLSEGKNTYKAWSALATKMPELFQKKNSEFDIHDLMVELEEIEKGRRRWGTPWNFVPLDKNLGDFQPGTSHIIAGRPSHGKSTLALMLAEKWTSSGLTVLYESLEMHEKDLTYRRLSRLSAIPLADFKHGRINDRWGLINEASTKIYDKKDRFIVNDRQYKNPDDIAIDIKIAHDLHGIKIFILDHWHRVVFPSSGDNYIHRGEAGYEKIISTCTNLGITPIILSQLTKEGERRDVKDRFPILADIRDIQRLVEAADTVMFVHYPYKFSNDIMQRNELWLRVAKCRDGRTGDEKIFYQPEIYTMEGL
jgi:replicative DNA helicase